jgi:hypothetical protein
LDESPEVSAGVFLIYKPSRWAALSFHTPPSSTSPRMWRDGVAKLGQETVGGAL